MQGITYIIPAVFNGTCLIPYVPGWKITHRLSKNLLSYNLAFKPESSGRSIQWIRSNQVRVGLFFLLLGQQKNLK